MPRRRPEFESGEAGAEAAKLEKFSDAGGSQNLWLPDAGRFTLFGREQYTFFHSFWKVDDGQHGSVLSRHCYSA
jgi:hypothetical protein